MGGSLPSPSTMDNNIMLYDKWLPLVKSSFEIASNNMRKCNICGRKFCKGEKYFVSNGSGRWKGRGKTCKECLEIAAEEIKNE